MSIAYHRRWWRKYMAVSYLASFSAGWFAVHADWLVAAPLFLIGIILGFAAGWHASAARKEFM